MTAPVPGGPTDSFAGEFDPAAISELVARSESTGPRAVEHALSAPRIDLDELATLLSPAAGGDYLEALCRSAHELTVRRFGRTIHMFAPLYVSNECVSSCTYCGFSKGLDVVRMTLSPDEVAEEAMFLTDAGIRHLLLVSGEHARVVSVDYLESVIARVAPFVPQISLEVQTWQVDEYRRLVRSGADGIVVYQETYDPTTYGEVHLRGRKRNFAERLSALDRAAAGGARRLGAGALLGLSPNWRFEVLALAAHAQWLTKRHWRCEISVALPRLRPCAGGLTSTHPVGDRDFTQAIAALRLFLPDAAIVLTTRESPSLRDALFPVGVTHMSAGSRTEPGGYRHLETRAQAQFDVDDTRSIADVAQAIAQAGYEPVWKDWARV